MTRIRVGVLPPRECRQAGNSGAGMPHCDVATLCAVGRTGVPDEVRARDDAVTRAEAAAEVRMEVVNACGDQSYISEQAMTRVNKILR